MVNIITLDSLDDDWLDLFERRARAANKRARKRGSLGTLTSSDLSDAYVQQQGACMYCDIRLYSDTVSVEHILSLANGGTNDAGNVGLACIECNNRQARADEKERTMAQDAGNRQELLAILEQLEQEANHSDHMRRHPNIRQSLHYRIRRIVGRLNQIGVFV